MQNYKILVVVASVAFLVGPWVLEAEPGPTRESLPKAHVPAAAGAAVPSESSGEEIFRREWIPNDPRSHGGDGLGPMFNETSCVGCHNLGGAGGGGPASKNVTSVSAVTAGAMLRVKTGVLGRLFVSPSKKEIARQDQAAKERMERWIPGLSSARAIVIHHSSTDEKYDQWKKRILTGTVERPSKETPSSEADNAAPKVKLSPPLQALMNFAEVLASERPPSETLGEHRKMFWREFTDFLSEFSETLRALSDEELEIQFGRMNLNMGQTWMGSLPNIRQKLEVNDTTGSSEFDTWVSDRNPTALFGSGLIDSIPDAVLEEAARVKHAGFDEVRGRVSRLADGRIGRFGWKGQTASLRDFTLSACAVELGLNVPGRPQSVPPYDAKYNPPGLDLNEAECEALIQYLRNLPAPKARTPVSKVHEEYLEQGRELFTSIGCATCHTQKLGDVSGIYSDLLLHEMGSGLSDDGSGYNGSPPTQGEIIAVTASAGDHPVRKRKVRAASSTEWRTPPLWGVRNSGPYLHEGQANTLESAIAFHGGQAKKSSAKFVKLTGAQKSQVIAFLKSLTPP